MVQVSDVAKMIDHTLLKAEATADQISTLLTEAKQYEFASVCINPIYVTHAAGSLTDSPVKVCTVIGFPLGANTATLKAMEATMAAKAGADEIDIVAHLPNLLNADVDAIRTELSEIVTAARAVNKQLLVKVIVESALLMKDVPPDTAEGRIAAACQAIQEAGCDFIKTSTGFHSTGGATVEAVKLMAKHADQLKVKAAGGVRNFDDAKTMIEAGASRLGCSAGVAIMQGASGGNAY